jgi:hypothetical protein
MGQLTEDMVRKIANFRQDAIDALLADLNAHEAVDALSADGACSLDKLITEFAVTGTDAYTLAAPTRTGQRKIIRSVLAASSPAATLTITSPDDTTGFVCPATFFFDVVGQEIELEATPALKWRCVRIVRAGDGDVTVGTTAITNKLWSRYNLSSTGAVGSTLPNGTVRGERVLLITKVVGLAGAGTITGVFNGGIDTAYTTITPFDTVASATVVGDHAYLEWNGAAWMVLNQSGNTLGG